jgi:hypothetical protein
VAPAADLDIVTAQLAEGRRHVFVGDFVFHGDEDAESARGYPGG